MKRLLPILFLLLASCSPSDRIARLEMEVSLLMAKVSELEKELGTTTRPTETSQPAIETGRFDSQFSRNGSHPTVVKVVKALMNDPASFEHVNTTRSVLSPHRMEVTMAYRGTNSFGALVMQTTTMEINENAKVLSIDGKEI
jgi:hypothetical protein